MNTLPDRPTEICELEAKKALAFFELKSTLNGRFLHYCLRRGGKRQLLSRLLFCVLICGTLALLEDVMLGLSVFALITVADLVDSFWVHHVWRRWRREVVPRTPYLIAIGTAALQSGANAVASLYAVYVLEASDVWQDTGIEAFGLICFFSIFLNAGLVFPYAPAIARVKLAITSAAWIAVLIYYLARVQNLLTFVQTNAFMLSAAIILGFVAYNFIKMVNDSFHRNQTARQALLRNQLALAQANLAAEEREQRANRLALIAENTGECIFVTDDQSRIFWTNRAFSQITGYGPEEVMGKLPGELLDAPETDVATILTINNLRDTGQKGRVEILNKFKDGSLHWMSSSLNPVFDQNGKLTMCISVERDVTEEKQRIRELAEAHEQVKAAAKAKERFFATMSHEIRTPMNGVLGMADLLSRTSLDIEQRSYLATIKESGDALLGIINDILDLSKLQSGKMQIVDEPFDLVEVTMGVVVLLRSLALEKSISLTFAPARPGPLWVAGDRGRVRQILMNLVGNAIKFTGKGGVTVFVGLDMAGKTVIKVQDTGIGISAERLEAIFDSFTQADSAVDRQFGGTGLGLTICRMLARAMNGDVQVLSQLGQGSVFTLTLPLPLANPVTRVAHLAVDTPVSHTRSSSTHILIAEDNGTNRFILRKMLQAEQVVLTEVVNGADAVAAYHNQVPDLVVMDMQMPVMDGLTAIRHIRDAENAKGMARCPIIVLSANAFAEDAKASLAAGCDEFMTKPVQHAALLDTVSRLLGQSAEEHALPATRLLA